MTTATGARHDPAGDEPEVEVLPDAEAAAAAAASRLATALADAVTARGRADWATTGGSTPVPIYRFLAQPPLRDRVPWDRVHVWWGDDRVVPRDHPLSNRLPFDQVLLRVSGSAGLSGAGDDGFSGRSGDWPGVPIPESNIHGMPIDLALGRSTSEEAAAREAAAIYGSALRAAPLERDGDGFPILDVVLVGVGPDGHVFSVFPESPLFDTEAWVSPVPAPQHVEPHVGRVSLHPHFLTAARLPLAVVLGGGKAAVVHDVLAGARDPRRLPAQLARRAGAVWILDEGANSQLRA
ncbi:MAG TPA: 6-phosphogluconolactonase [Candidatus Limnocylindrales bacterium]